jgi:hypothetical protein
MAKIGIPKEIHPGEKRVACHAADDPEAKEARFRRWPFNQVRATRSIVPIANIRKPVRR